MKIKILILGVLLAATIGQAGELSNGSYIPDDLGTNRVRGAIEVEDETIGVGIPEWRGFSYRTRCLLGNNADSVLVNTAALTGHPEIAFSGRNHVSHSVGAQAVLDAAADMDRAICIMAYHSQWTRYRAMSYWNAGVNFTSIPAIVPAGASDHNSHVCESAARYMRRWGRGNWTSHMEKGAAHTRGDNESRRFVRLWLEDVIDWRVPDVIPLDDYPVLNNAADTNGWFVNYDLIYNVDAADQFINPVMYSAAELPGDPGEYIWVPSRRVAEAFVNYTRRGNIEGSMEFRIGGGTFIRLSYPTNPTWIERYFESSNGDGDVVWSLASGSLPEGATLDSTLGRINTFTITSNCVGVHEFTIEAQDRYGKASRDYRLLIESDSNANKPVAGIVSPTSGAVYTEGQTISFTGTGTDVQDGDVVSNAKQRSRDRRNRDTDRD